MTPVQPHKRRVILKLSGEAIGPADGLGVDMDSAKTIARAIAGAPEDIEIGLVIGAGNLVRGKNLAAQGVNPTIADYMGILATAINGLGLQEAMECVGRHSCVMSAIDMGQLAERYTPRRCLEYLEEGKVVVLVAGTGNPHFTTDTAGALRARELQADCLLKATNVDGVYSGDPGKDENAEFYSTISYDDFLVENLKVMDAAAIAICREANIPVIVFNQKKPGNIEAALKGENIGTTIGG